MAWATPRACSPGWAAGATAAHALTQPRAPRLTPECGARSLAARGFRVLAADCRGHGDSTRSAEARYSVAALAEDLESLVVQLVTWRRGWGA
jgi:pimeloyl-ACP methyl ester carboxylesterase